MTKELSHQLALLASKLNIGVEHLWGVLVKQVYIGAVTDLIQYGIMIALTVIFCKKLKAQKFDDSDDNAMYIQLAYAGGAFVLVTLWSTAFFCFPNTISAFFNPEYAALKLLLSTIKGEG